MTSETDICNRALGIVGARDTISGMAERSNSALQCRIFYQPTRDALLRAAQWNFARFFAPLVVLKAVPGTPENPGPGTPQWVPATQPAPPWRYSYAYPPDCLALRQITTQCPAIGLTGTPIQSVPSNWAQPSYATNPALRFISGTDKNAAGQRIRVILTNAAQALAIYTGLVDDPNLWDAGFEEAMVNSLGARLAIPLSGDKTLAKLAMETAQSAIMKARTQDANEGLTNVNVLPDWMAVRGVAGDWSTPQNQTTLWRDPSYLCN